MSAQRLHGRGGLWIRCFLSLLLTSAVLAGDGEIVDITVRGRTASLYEPTSYNAETPTALIVLMHGAGSCGDAIQEAISLADEADSDGFLYVYPDGMTNSSGNRTWNATDGQ